MPIELTAAAVSGTSFTRSMAPALPRIINAGQSTTVAITFTPSSTRVGNVTGSLHVASSVGAIDAGLYGLSMNGLQGGNEPPLSKVVTALGFDIDVGGTGLSLGTGAAPIGDEVSHPLFRRADAGVVGLTAVARYSPDETLPFGWYLPAADGGVASTTLVGTIALGDCQTLNPRLTPDSGTSFDPGTARFGLYVNSNTFNRKTYTQDALNTGPDGAREPGVPAQRSPGSPGAERVSGGVRRRGERRLPGLRVRDHQRRAVSGPAVQTFASKLTLRCCGAASPCSRRSATTRSARASTAARASSRVLPYAMTPARSMTSAIQRPSVSSSSSTLNFIAMT